MMAPPPIRVSTSIFVLIAATLLQKFISIQLLRYGPVGICPNNLPDTHRLAPFEQHRDRIEVDGIKNAKGKLARKIRAEICQAFSESYYEARSKFRSAAEAVTCTTLHSLQVIPNRDYTIDIAVIPGGGDGLVIHTSGCHGVEGYAGSSIQVAFLHHLASLSDDTATENAPTIVLVHALNPYGMAHYRRTNENNVDLNRNALTDDEWPEVLARDPNIVGYDDFDAALFNPQQAPTWFGAYGTFFLKAVTAIARYGFVTMKRSLVAAQYHNPQGIFYGGKELQASHVLLRDFLTGYTSNTSGLVSMIDVHTGLGPTGVDTLLVHGVPDALSTTTSTGGAEEDAVFYDAPRPVQYHFGRVEEISDNNSEEKASSPNSDVTAGYDLSRGILNDYYAKLFAVSPSARPLVVTQEFGTTTGLLVARGMILENMAFQYVPQQQPFWSLFSRDVFYIRTDEWRRSILTRGLTVLRQAIERSMSSKL